MPSKYQLYPAPAYFVDWLNAGAGRGEYFHHIDPSLPPPKISKMKLGIIPITLADAYRLERAQKPSTSPLRAELLMTFEQDRELHRYIKGIDPAPAEYVAPERPLKRSTISSNNV